ncbi:hypothetical protein [Methanolobus sp.]|uniref:hypothetical protein n=1 Tax=Methanolobus sp. TaxID=1874737 RepID=UPI0025D340BB|nr:hypothetical protein [Methanolobus sp.]
MVPGLLDETLLNHTYPLDLFESIFIIVVSLLSVALITKKFIKNEHFEDRSTKENFIVIYSFAFLFLYFAFAIFLKESAYYIGFTFILVCEVLFLQSLRVSRIKKTSSYPEKYQYNSTIAFISTSLISVLYLLFIFIIVVKSSFSIDEANVNIFGTLLLIAVFNTLYGISIEDNLTQHYQLHAYSYLFIVIAVFLTIMEKSWFTTSFFNLTAYFLSLFSAKEISLHKDNKFYSSTFKVMLIILVLTGFISSAYISSYIPIVTFTAIGLLVVASLVTLKDKKYDETQQIYLFWVIVLCCIILYFLLSGKIFILSYFYDVFIGLLA